MRRSNRSSMTPNANDCRLSRPRSPASVRTHRPTSGASPITGQQMCSPSPGPGTWRGGDRADRGRSADLLSPLDHVLQLGEIVTVIRGMNLGGEQGNALSDERIGVVASGPMDGPRDLPRVASGGTCKILQDRVLASVLVDAGKRVPDVGVPGDD